MKTNKTVFALIVAGASIFSVWFWLEVMPYNQARQARFNIDVLGRYLISSRIMTDRIVKSLAEVPEFEIVSTRESLALKSAAIRDGKEGPYRYHLENLGEFEFVISASPSGLFAPREEFGMTEQGILKYNTVNVDPFPDSREEVNGWESIFGEAGLKTKSR